MSNEKIIKRIIRIGKQKIPMSKALSINVISCIGIITTILISTLLVTSLVGLIVDMYVVEISVDMLCISVIIMSTTFFAVSHKILVLKHSRHFKRFLAASSIKSMRKYLKFCSFFGWFASITSATICILTLSCIATDELFITQILTISYFWVVISSIWLLADYKTNIRMISDFIDDEKNERLYLGDVDLKTPIGQIIRKARISIERNDEIEAMTFNRERECTKYKNVIQNEIRLVESKIRNSHNNSEKASQLLVYKESLENQLTDLKNYSRTILDYSLKAREDSNSMREYIQILASKDLLTSYQNEINCFIYEKDEKGKKLKRKNYIGNTFSSDVLTQQVFEKDKMKALIELEQTEPFITNLEKKYSEV